MSRQSDRYRNWWFILYPESAPDDWRDTLEQLCIPVAISPLHDKDLDKTDNYKKPHYHIILKYGGVKSYNQISRLTRSLNQPIPLPVESLKGAYEYLTHVNSPEKYQYSPDDIKHLNGFKPIVSDEDNNMGIHGELCKLIKDNNITEFSQLVELVVSLNKVTYLSVITKEAYFFSQYVTSLRHSAIRQQDQEYASSQLIGFPISDSRELPPDPLQMRTLWEVIE